MVLLEQTQQMKENEKYIGEHEESFYEGMEESNEPDFLDEPVTYLDGL